MKSTLYPNILFLKNDNLAFLGTSIAQRQALTILHPSSTLNNHYAQLASKLFKEIKIVKEMMWIGKVPSTQIIRIYFSQPYQYPVALCCKSPVYIEVENDRTGSILCSKCHKQVLKFVKAGKGPDEEMFKIVQKQMKERKCQLKTLLTSLKFRGRKLRNNFLNDSSTNNSDLIVELTQNNPTIPLQSPLSNTLTPSLLELRDIVSDIFS